MIPALLLLTVLASCSDESSGCFNVQGKWIVAAHCDSTQVGKTWTMDQTWCRVSGSDAAGAWSMEGEVFESTKIKVTATQTTSGGQISCEGTVNSAAITLQCLSQGCTVKLTAPGSGPGPDQGIPAPDVGSKPDIQPPPDLQQPPDTAPKQCTSKDNVCMGSDSYASLRYCSNGAMVTQSCKALCQAKGAIDAEGCGYSSSKGANDCICRWPWVYDGSTGLYWQESPSTNQVTLGVASQACQALSLGNIKSWRLPDISELRTLVAGCSSTQTGGSCKVTKSCTTQPCWDYTKCAGCASGSGPGSGGCYWSGIFGPCKEYWSSTKNNPQPYDQYWTVDFSTASISQRPSTKLAYYRCVYQ